MSELLAIFGTGENDAELIDEIARRHPRRVTVLLQDAPDDWALDESAAGLALRARLALLMATIEHDTGATVTGLAGSRDQLAGWRFDHEVGGRPAVVA